MSAYTPTDLVQLPRMSIGVGSALGQQTLAAGFARQEDMPAPVFKAYTSLGAAHAAMLSAMVDQFGHAGSADDANEPAVQELDRILDNCWGGADDRLLGLTKLPPGTPGAAEAASLRKRLFPTGLSFLKLPYRLEWSESQVRIDLIERDHLAPTLADLAGNHFLPAILEAHANYGKALGMTYALPGTPLAPQVKAPLDAFANALRTYIVKVVASVDEDDPSTQTLADTLLAPLARWTSPPAKSGKDAPATPGGAGAPADPPPAGG